MDIALFQKKLNDLCEFAEQNDMKISTDKVREYFEYDELEMEQLVRILQYLKSKGIEITGIDLSAEVQEDENSISKGTQVPLTHEEEKFLENYLEELSENVLQDAEREEQFRRAAAGDDLACAVLTRHYLTVSAGIAKEMNCEEIALQDLIQEASVGLLMAFDSEEAVYTDEWFRSKIKETINAAIEEQTEQKIHDNALVSKVEKLESAVKELTDEEDGELKFTIAELAVILDMEESEIKDILKLTGDDK